MVQSCMSQTSNSILNNKKENKALHPDDLQEARERLNKVWVPWEKRFGDPDTGHAVDPEIKPVAPPPEEAKEPLRVAITRKANEANAKRAHLVEIASTTDPCPATALNHRWNRHGRKSEGTTLRKRCRDCGKIRAVSPEEYVAIGKTVANAMAFAS